MSELTNSTLNLTNFDALDPHFHYIDHSLLDSDQKLSTQHNIRTVLSIDGGGSAGIIPATVLVDLESMVKQPIVDYFDLIAGTSTGSIIAALLCTPDAENQAKYSCTQIKDLYQTLPEKVFHIDWWHQILSLGGLIGPKFSNKSISYFVNKIFGELNLSDLRAHFIAPCTLEKRQRPFWFDSNLAKQHKKENFKVADMLLSTTAAPTIFAPHRLINQTRSFDDWGSDGGVFVNNPALQAYIMARAAYPNDKLFIISLGTTRQNMPMSMFKNYRYWGLLRGLEPMINNMLDIESYQTALQMALLSLNPNSNIAGYFRFNPQTDQQCSFFSGSPSNMSFFSNEAMKLVQQNQTRLTFCAQILRDIKK